MSSPVDMKFEIVVLPVSDVDRAKEFYSRLGWRLDADFASGEDYRVIQFTPPGSGCSIIFGKNVTAATPGTVQGLYLIVSDIAAARAELLGHGVRISEVFHAQANVYTGTDKPFLFGSKRVDGPDPDHASYRSFSSFNDPDGNGWFLQEITSRLPGRLDPAATTFSSATDLTAALRRAAEAHGATRHGSVNPTPTGRSGMPNIWFANRLGLSRRSKAKPRDLFLDVRYAGYPASIHDLKSATRSAGHASSGGIEPSATLS